MEKVSLSNKVFTENPLLDEIIYNARQLATGTVLKDWDRANNNETLESIQAGDILIAIKQGTIQFEYFDYDEYILRDYVDEDHLHLYAENNNLIPESLRPTLLNDAIKEFEENYFEYNNYYRMLHGEPDYDEERPLWEGLWIDTLYIDELIPTSVDHISTVKEDSTYELIHELDLAYNNLLYSNGTFENILNDEVQLEAWGLTKDDVSYLLHTGDRSISYYDARSAEKFALIYCPPCDSEEVKRRYKDLIEANRLYLLYTIYSDAYKYRSDYYDNFMMIFIILQTIIDMIVELPEYIIRRDIFDARTCKYIFESNGVKYFRDIPLKYQVALVKNLNKLIKFKSTDKCIVDISSIFGTENIQIFRYYIMKDRYANKVTDPETLDTEYNYYNNQKTIVDSEGHETVVPDNSSNYDIKFIKVPLIGNYDDYIRTESNIYKYDSVVDGDSYWIGDQDYKTIKNDIKDLDFTVLRSKYYSIEAVIDITKRNFTLVYFMNMLMYNKIDKTKLKVNLPNISTTKKFELVDVILALYSLSYIYYGVEDTILDSRAKVAQILGFNMEADLGKIASYLEENYMGLTLEDLKVNTYTIPDNKEFMSFNQLQEIYFTNKDCYDHVRDMLLNPPSKELYDAYNFIYKSMFIMNRNMEYFIIDDESGVLEKYRDGKGYKVKFITIPKEEDYTVKEDFKRDWNWLLESMDYETLYLEMDDNFDENHKFKIYTKSGHYRMELKGTCTMADTYRNFLRSKDAAIYNFLQSIASIANFDSRQEACVNAIQSIISYLKDYIDQTGDNAINLDTVFSTMPSVSPDFIKKYVTEVIDFFKSFKIFTQGSSIIYLFRDKYEHTVKLIEHIIINYLFDKSELIRIEDTIGAMRTNLSTEERMGLLDKVWFNIDTWIIKNYNEYYNSENYSEKSDRIREMIDRFTTLTMEDECILLDSIAKILIDLKYYDKVNMSDKTYISETRDFNEYYNEWMVDIIAAFDIKWNLVDRLNYQDDISSYYYHDFEEFEKLIDGRKSIDIDSSIRDRYNLIDSYYSIITQEF